MRCTAPTPKTAEAAQANLGGLECSSYTWQVRHGGYDASGPDCQGHPVPARRDPNAVFRKNRTIYKDVKIFTPASRAVIQPESGGE